MLLDVRLKGMLKVMEHKLHNYEINAFPFLIFYLPIYLEAVPTKSFERYLNHLIIMHGLINDGHIQFLEFRREVNLFWFILVFDGKSFFGELFPMFLVEAYENNRDLTSIFDKCLLIRLRC